MQKFSILLYSMCFLIAYANGQSDIETTYTDNTFEGTRVVVGHSVETDREGDMNMLISHKFGAINTGAYEFFGLDQAIIRIGFDYAVKDWVTVGIGRSSLDKIADGFVKFRILRQQTGARSIPISITTVSTSSYSFLKSFDPLMPIVAQNRFAFCHQVLIARKFSQRLSFQVMPTVVHYNLVESRAFPNDVFSLGFAGKIQLTKALALKGEYYYTFANQLDAFKTNSLAFGFDIDTGSHVFQLNLSNAGGLIEPAFIGDTTGTWLDGNIHIGFTINRVFRLKGRRY